MDTDRDNGTRRKHDETLDGGRLKWLQRWLLTRTLDLCTHTRQFTMPLKKSLDTSWSTLRMTLRQSMWLDLHEHGINENEIVVATLTRKRIARPLDTSDQAIAGYWQSVGDRMQRAFRYIVNHELSHIQLQALEEARRERAREGAGQKP